MGIEAEKVEEIIAQHVETVDGLKEEIKKYKAEADKLPEAQKELNSLKKQVEKYAEKDYDKLKAEFDDYKKTVADKEARAAKEKAFRELLKDASLSEKGIEKALKYAAWDSIKVGDDGKIVDAKDQLKAVKDEWADYIQTTETKGAQSANPPAGIGAATAPSRAAAAANRYYTQMYGETAKGGESK
jgi:DNA repair exonuclease SbcCD ATPase subunit